MPKHDSFFITLTSNTSLDLYPQNTLSRFTTKLPISLDFKNNNNGEWYVGVSKFACTKIEEKTEPKPEPKIIFISEKDNSTSDKVSTASGVEKKPLEFEIIDMLREYPNVFEIIQKEDFFDRYTIDIDLPYNFFPNTTVHILVDTYRCNTIFNSELSLREFFDMIFFQIKKPDRRNIVKKLKQSIAKTKPMALDTIIQNNIMKIVKIVQPKIMEHPDGYSIPNYICIYSDIVQPQVFGNVMARGMVMHPVKFQKQYNDYQNCDIVNIQYLPLEKNRITDISILMADENGEQINFINDTFSTMIVLHFRKGI